MRTARNRTKREQLRRKSGAAGHSVGAAASSLLPSAGRAPVHAVAVIALAVVVAALVVGAVP